MAAYAERARAGVLPHRIRLRLRLRIDIPISVRRARVIMLALSFAPNSPLRGSLTYSDCWQPRLDSNQVLWQRRAAAAIDCHKHTHKPNLKHTYAGDVTLTLTLSALTRRTYRRNRRRAHVHLRDPRSGRNTNASE